MCTVLYDGEINTQFNRFTNMFGGISVMILVEERIETCTLQLNINTTQWFTSFEISYQLSVNHSAIIPPPSTSPSLAAKVTILVTIALSSLTVIAGLIYFGIKFYQKTVKRKFEIKKIKL